MAKKLNDPLIKVIQNTPKTAISKHSKRQKFEDKDSQKTQSMIEFDAYACIQLYKNLSGFEFGLLLLDYPPQWLSQIYHCLGVHLCFLLGRGPDQPVVQVLVKSPLVRAISFTSFTITIKTHGAVARQKGSEVNWNT